MNKIRTRFAPSPTGYLHVGGARTALFNWLFARHHGGAFILRIEDTDVERSTESSADAIIDSLSWLGLDWDEGPYYQSERLATYREHAERLLEAGYAYYCYCTPEELEAERSAALSAGRNPHYSGRCRGLSREERLGYEREGRKPVVRFKMPGGTTTVKDLIRGEVEFDNGVFDDFIILKSDGFPTYNFANVIDDTLMGMTHVIRGEEHLSNTPKQIALYRALGFPMPEFAHVSMILGPDRTKLSKRHGATSLGQYRDMGYLPEALMNYLALLGWAYDASTEIFSREELIEKFTLDRVSKNPAVFDPKKLEWMNGYYIRATDSGRLQKLIREYLEATGLIREPLDPDAERKLEGIVELVRDRIHKISDVTDVAGFFFTDEVEYDPAAREKLWSKPGVAGMLRELAGRLRDLPEFEAASIENTVRGFAAERGVKAGEVIHPARLALTGKSASPGLFEVMALLGRRRTLERLERAIEAIERG